jgi:hypothetical protein
MSTDKKEHYEIHISMLPSSELCICGNCDKFRLWGVSTGLCIKPYGRDKSAGQKACKDFIKKTE